MSERKEEETPEPSPRRIDRRALERGVRKALAIKPKDRKSKEKERKAPQQDSNLQP